MGYFAAFWGGFSSFFSIWQVCILQISPFFMIFITGMFFTVQQTTDAPADMTRWIIVPALAYTLGFGVFFALLSARGLYVGRYLAYNVESLQLASGMFFLCVAGFFILSDRLASLQKRLTPLVVGLLFLFLGMTFAFIYSPCITPTLSKILGIAVRSESAVLGAFLAGFYGLGMSLAFLVTGFALVSLLKNWDILLHHARLIKDSCAALLLILAAMNLSGIMVYYKAFFLGLLVP